MHSIEVDPKTSLRRRSHSTNISKSHLQRIFEENKLKAFKPIFVHTLEDHDEGRRLDFCLSIGEKILESSDFYKNIFFTDESTFTTNGTVSSQNCRYWARNNPGFRIHCRRQYFKNVNVWCGVSYYHGIIGPYFIEGRLNQNSYLTLLKKVAGDYLDNLPLQQMILIHFQQDGCPAHSTRQVAEWLNTEFREKWIGRNGPIQWPPRSPDLSILDFFLWGRLKQLVYAQTLPNDAEVLKEKIREAVNSIPLEDIRNSFKEFRRRIEVCVDRGGSYIE